MYSFWQAWHCLIILGWCLWLCWCWCLSWTSPVLLFGCLACTPGTSPVMLLETNPIHTSRSGVALLLGGRQNIARTLLILHGLQSSTSQTAKQMKPWSWRCGTKTWILMITWAHVPNRCNMGLSPLLVIWTKELCFTGLMLNKSVPNHHFVKMLWDKPPLSVTIKLNGFHCTLCMFCKYVQKLWHFDFYLKKVHLK